METQSKNLSTWLYVSGVIALVAALVLFAGSFFPVGKEDAKRSTSEEISLFAGDDSGYVKRMAAPLIAHQIKTQMRWASPGVAEKRSLN